MTKSLSLRALKVLNTDMISQAGASLSSHGTNRMRSMTIYCLSGREYESTMNNLKKDQSSQIQTKRTKIDQDSQTETNIRK